MTYPPAGLRGWGPMVAHARHGTTLAGHAAAVAPHLTGCVLLETAEAVEQVHGILAVDGIDLVVLAPFDLSTALGVPGRFDAPVFVDAVTAIERAAAARGTPLGGVALTAEAGAALEARGHRVVARGIDTQMLADQVAAFRPG